MNDYGLKHIYGGAYNAWVATHEIENGGDLPDMASDPVQLAKWTHNCIAFISEFSQLDQGFALCISVRDVLTEAKWDQWQSGGYQNIGFALNASLFEHYDYPRLRGVSAVLISAEQEVYPWRIILTPPLRQRVQTAGAMHDTVMEVPRRRRVTLGRVETQNTYRTPDVSGLMTLYNLNPCVHRGAPMDDEKWYIRAIRSPRSIDDSKIDDIRLEFILVGFPA